MLHSVCLDLSKGREERVLGPTCDSQLRIMPCLQWLRVVTVRIALHDVSRLKITMRGRR